MDTCIYMAESVHCLPETITRIIYNIVVVQLLSHV